MKIMGVKQAIAALILIFGAICGFIYLASIESQNRKVENAVFIAKHVAVKKEIRRQGSDRNKEAIRRFKAVFSPVEVRGPVVVDRQVVITAGSLTIRGDSP